MANLKKTMFREYDIRGRVSDDELNEESVELISKAFGTMLRKRGVGKSVLGYDYRKCSEKFNKAFLKGLLSCGIEVIKLGLITTPMMYLAQYHYKSKGGAVITASHNPTGWSGFKLGLGYGHTLVPDEVKELYQLTKSEDFKKGEGKEREENFKDIYKKELLKRVKMKRKLKVVVNTGNGTAGIVAPEVLKEAGVEVVELHTDLNWEFPNYFPNPSTEEMMKDTGKKVVSERADLGVAFDGDGDRLGVTDEKGEMVFPDQFLILLAREVLKKKPGAKIIFDVKCTQSLEEDIKNHGGKPIMWITGHSYIKAKRKEEGAPLAGECSGHIFFGEPIYYGFDDGLFAGLKLIEYISKRKESFSEIMKGVPKYISTPTIHVDCPDEVKYEVVEKLVDDFKKEGYNVNDINGARVSFSDGWGLVRASSNLPVLVLRFEAKTKERLKEIEELFKEKLSRYKEVADKWHSG